MAVNTIGAGVILNEGSIDVDFRVESNGSANMLFVDGGNDRVGIGCTPGYPLAVEGTSSALGDSRTILEVRDDTSMASGVGGGIAFSGVYTGSSITRLASIWGEKENGTDDEYGGQLHLGTRVNDGTISSDLVIDSAGKIGIGTDSPDSWEGTAFGAKLQVEGQMGSRGVLPAFIFDETDQSANARIMDIVMTGGVLSFRKYNDNGSSANTMMAIERSSGRVGIGTNAPSIGLLDVRYTGGSSDVDTATVLNLKQEASSTTANIRFNTATSNSAGHIIFNTDGSFQIRTDASNLTTFANNGDATFAGNIASENFSSETSYGGGGADVDSLKRAGFYRIENDASGMPASNYFSMIVAGNGSNVTSQWAVDLLGGQTYTRSFNTSWTSWLRIDD